MEIKVIQSIINKYAAKATGTSGFYFKDLSTGQVAGYNEKTVMPSASVFKIFVLAELLRQVHEGRFDLNDRFTLKEEYKSNGSGVLQLMKNDLQPTLNDYATLMMILSDNTAADFLFNLVGRNNIMENVLEPLKLRQTKCDLTCRDLISICYGGSLGITFEEACKLDEANCSLRNAPPYTGELMLNDETSAFDAGKMMECFYNNDWVNDTISKQALDIMRLCQTNGRIPHLLPIGTQVAHKTGTMDRVVNDVGIVYTEKGDYLLSLFYNGNTASEEEYNENTHGYFGEKLLAELSLSIFKEYIE